MLNRNSEKQNQFKKSVGKLANGLLVLTGFVSFANQSGLVNQVVSNLDQYLMPAAQAKDIGMHHIAIADEQLNQKLGANSLIVEDKTAFLVNQVGEKTVAPSGYYKLSDGSILKVKDGQITNVASSELNSEKTVNSNSILQAKKRRWLQGIWSQGDFKRRLSPQKVTKRNVRETLNRVIES